MFASRLTEGQSGLVQHSLQILKGAVPQQWPELHWLFSRQNDPLSRWAWPAETRQARRNRTTTDPFMLD